MQAINWNRLPLHAFHQLKPCDNAGATVTPPHWHGRTARPDRKRAGGDTGVACMAGRQGAPRDMHTICWEIMTMKHRHTHKLEHKLWPSRPTTAQLMRCTASADAWKGYADHSNHHKHAGATKRGRYVLPRPGRLLIVGGPIVTAKCSLAAYAPNVAH